MQARAAGAAASVAVEEAADRLCALEGDDEEDEDVMDGANSLHRRGVLPRLTRGTWTVRTKKRKRKRR